MTVELTIPTILTLGRVAAIPVMMFVYFFGGEYGGQLAAIVFIVAALTDWLDGYLARRLGQSSKFGAFLDPVADKLIVAAALVLVVHNYQSIFVTVCSAVIIGREITISALREWMAEMGDRGVVAVSWWGKWKTTMQMIALPTLLWQKDIYGLPTEKIGFVSLAIASLLTLVSMTSYLQAALKSLDTSN